MHDRSLPLPRDRRLWLRWSIVRETEFWQRMDIHIGPAYSRVWASQQHLAGLNERTVDQAMADGVDCKTIWRVVWEALNLPHSER